MKKIRDLLIGVLIGAGVVTGIVAAQAGGLKDIDRVAPFDLDSLWLMKQARAIIEAYQVDADSDDVTEKDLLYGAVDGMVSAWGDPYTRFVDPERLEQEQTDLRGKYGGLGIYIGQRDGAILVISPIEGTPAEKADLKPQDQIVKIGDEVVIGWDLHQVVENLRGEPGTPVTIWIRREGEQDLLKKDMVREEIKLESVRYEMLSDDIGYVRLSQFKDTSPSDVGKAIIELKAQGATGLILDLRNNGGGLLNAAVEISDMFLDGGLVVGTKGRVDRANEELFATPGVLTDLPLVVLINEGSASASEIVAGAVRDRDRALLVGRKSFGKGSVQTLFNLMDGSALYVTIARYHTPNGTIIDHLGISPDLDVKGDWSREKDKDVQLKGAQRLMTAIKEGKVVLPLSGDLSFLVVSEDHES
ncbi:S41 family peptidase [Dethiosulfovibrio salsuginis]|uniref:Carboxyl-terminal processing protease n=1 Tax=Dethiosulfovibrio salsuginis TaxID=561720 RepID=A0A1X7K6E3_9BACT|nr:S41 family peptidase [Dethiosulfovibrio salsuginis]SMG36232.1 carboxyl-terminal processing protease [Dethiosulfovibrio salsuginis]